MCTQRSGLASIPIILSALLSGVLTVPLVTAEATAAVPEFTEHVIFTDPLGFGWFTRNLYPADFDGDGDVDLVFCNRYGDLWWSESSGGAAPTFTTRVLDELYDCRAVYATDLDSDGDLDLMAASAIGQGDVRWYENTGGSPVQFSVHVMPTTGIDYFALHAADLDGDHVIDVLTGTGPSGPSSSQLAWHENLGGRPPAFAENEVSRNLAWVTSIETGDIDGDGDIDIVAGSNDWGLPLRIAWYRNSGQTPPQFEEYPLLVGSGEGASVSVSDLDGDGDMDIVAGVRYPNSEGELLWYENDGQSPPVFSERILRGRQSGSFSFVFPADLDGDGDVDLVSGQTIGSEIGQFEWYENNGESPPSFQVHTIADVNAAADLAFAIDMDHDGDMDVLAREDKYLQPARLLWYENRSGGGNQSADAWLRALGDTNRDGTPEIAVIARTADGKNRATVTDAATGGLIAQFEFSAALRPVDVTTLPAPDPSAAPGLILLGAAPASAETRDALTGQLRGSVAFDPTVQPLDLAVLPDQNANGVPELAMLATGSTTVEIRDARDGTWLNTLSFPAQFTPRQVLALPDLNGNGSAEVGVVLSDEGKADRVTVKDARTGALLKTLWSGADLRQAEPVADRNGNGAPEVAMLWQDPAAQTTHVWVVDAGTQQRLASLAKFRQGADSLKLVVVDDLTGNRVEDYAVLGRNPLTGDVTVTVLDGATGQWLNRISYNPDCTPLDLASIADTNGNGAADLVMLGRCGADRTLRAFVKDAKTGTLLQRLNF